MYSDRLEIYLNQTAQYQAQTKADSYGNMQYAPPINIEVRIEGGSRTVRSTNGETVVASTTVFAVQQINPMDKINGRLVINSTNMIDNCGNVVGWEAYL